MEGTEQATSTDMPIRSRWPHPLRTFGHRNFRLFWFGQLVSLSGSWMQIVALNWLAYRLTNSPLMLGLINFVALLPVGLVSLVGGVLSDRFPRRSLLLATETMLALQALILTILSWVGSVHVWHIMVVTFIVGAGNAIEQPTRFVFLMDIVGKEDFTNAVGLNSSVVHLARSIGPAVAGILISTMGETSCFFLNFVTYLVAILTLLLMRLPATKRFWKPVRLKGDLLDGLKYMWQSQTIKGLLLLLAVSSFLSRPYIVLMPVFARDVLQADARGYGLLMSAIGVGSVCGALAAASLKQGYHGRWLVGASLAFPVFLILFAFSRWMLLSIGLLLLASTSQLTQQVVASSSLQLATTDEFHGRVASFLVLLNNGLTRLGGIQAGAVTQYWSAPVSVSGGAILSLVCMLIVIWCIPAVRQLQ